MKLKTKSIKNKCEMCNRLIITFPCRVKKGYDRFCSSKCWGKSKKGKKCSPEMRKKMSKATQGSNNGNWKGGKPRCKKCASTISRTATYCARCRPRGGKLNPYWKGGRFKRKVGYISITVPNHPYKTKCGYVFEHRWIVEKCIGRYLKSAERVHHLGKRDNNLPHMLMAFKDVAVHQRFHRNPSSVKPSEIIFDGRLLKRKRIKEA